MKYEGRRKKDCGTKTTTVVTPRYTSDERGDATLSDEERRQVTH
jgi:hypothetical protein